MVKELKISVEILDVFWIVENEILCTIVQIGDKIHSELVYEKEQ